MECAPTQNVQEGMVKCVNWHGSPPPRSPSSAPARAEAQQTPRKGGTIRMTAPYAASFGSLDPHTTPRAQDDIVDKALQRTLYNWDSASNKLVLELAKSVTVVGRRPHLHLQAARRRLLPQRPQDDGRRHHLVVHAHHGRQQGLSRRALRPPDQGRGRRREGPGQGDFRPEEDRRLHARDDADRHASIPGFYFFAGTTAILPKEEVEKGNFASNPVGLGPFKFKEHIPGSRVVARALRQVLQARQALRSTSSRC